MQIAQKTKPTTRQGVFVPVPMSLEDACMIEWEILRGPNLGKRGRIFELYKLGLLDLGDLIWISQRAYDSRAKMAALTILAHQIGQPHTIEAVSHYGPKVVGTDQYLEEKQYDGMMNAVFYAAIGVMVGVFLGGALISRGVEMLTQGWPWVLVLIGVGFWFVVLGVPAGLYLRYRILREVSQFRNFRLGREGEERVLDAMRAHLDNRWTIFRNLVLPGNRKDDIDFVLVCPIGIWALEIKTYSHNTKLNKNSKDKRGLRQRWSWGDEPHWRMTPDKQAQNNARRLKELLKQRGVDIPWVGAVLVFPEYQPRDFSPVVQNIEVWRASEIDVRLEALGASVISNEQQASRIADTIRVLSAQ